MKLRDVIGETVMNLTLYGTIVALAGLTLHIIRAALRS